MRRLCPARAYQLGNRSGPSVHAACAAIPAGFPRTISRRLWVQLYAVEPARKERVSSDATINGMDSKLVEWQSAQRRVQQLEQQLAIAMVPEIASRESINIRQVQEDLASAKRMADRALQACLSEAQRSRQVHKSIGVDTGTSSL